jgi:hypothetical protein
VRCIQVGKDRAATRKSWCRDSKGHVLLCRSALDRLRDRARITEQCCSLEPGLSGFEEAPGFDQQQMFDQPAGVDAFDEETLGSGSLDLVQPLAARPRRTDRGSGCPDVRPGSAPLPRCRPCAAHARRSVMPPPTRVASCVELQLRQSVLTVNGKAAGAPRADVYRAAEDAVSVRTGEGEGVYAPCRSQPAVGTDPHLPELRPTTQGFQ